MRFLVEVQLKPNSKEAAMQVFEQRGPNRNPHVKFVNGWIGTKSDMAFILIDSDAETHVVDACHGWSSFGDTKVYPVVDIEQY